VSVSIVLVPLAVAAVAAAGARSGRDAKGRVVCEVRTRMRDVTLLTAALRDTGAVVVQAADGALDARWEGVQAVFRRDEAGAWSAHFTGETDEQRAVAIINAVDAAYGRQVQRVALERLRERAPAAGLRLESESVAADASVRLVFEVVEKA
jgi:hypothetical protein